jgi:hypothetical protein
MLDGRSGGSLTTTMMNRDEQQRPKDPAPPRNVTAAKHAMITLCPHAAKIPVLELIARTQSPVPMHRDDYASIRKAHCAPEVSWRGGGARRCTVHGAG